MPRLIWFFAGRTCHFRGFVMRRLIHTKSQLVITLDGFSMTSINYDVVSWEKWNYFSSDWLCSFPDQLLIHTKTAEAHFPKRNTLVKRCTTEIVHSVDSVERFRVDSTMCSVPSAINCVFFRTIDAPYKNKILRWVSFIIYHIYQRNCKLFIFLFDSWKNSLSRTEWIKFMFLPLLSLYAALFCYVLYQKAPYYVGIWLYQFLIIAYRFTFLSLIYSLIYHLILCKILVDVQDW